MIIRLSKQVYILWGLKYDFYVYPISYISKPKVKIHIHILFCETYTTVLKWLRPTTLLIK